MGQKLGSQFSASGATAVIAPAIGGIIVAHEVAAALNVRAIFGERSNGRMILRRGFEIYSDDRLIVVEDVITTGKSTREIIALAGEYQGEIVGIGALALRSSGPMELPSKPKALLNLNIENWSEAECPLCKQGIPITTPGSRYVR